MNVMRYARNISAFIRKNQIASIHHFSFKTTGPLVCRISTISPIQKTIVNAAPASFQGLLPYRQYSHGVEYDRHMLTEKILLILRLFDKVDPEKLTVDSLFGKDLGLDSLDQVEVIMAIEDEFSFEIPDQDAERFRCPKDIVQYLCDKLDIFE